MLGIDPAKSTPADWQRAADAGALLEVLARVNRELGTTTVVITHNASIAGMADRVIRLSDGLVASERVNATRLSPSELSW